MRKAARRSPDATATRRSGKASPIVKAEAASAADMDRLLHELQVHQHEVQVHQIELQVQNEELLAARAELEFAVGRYTELFDLAPIGYATLAGDGTIQTINHAGARLLRCERSRLVGEEFSAFLDGTSAGAFAALVARALAGSSMQDCEVARDAAKMDLRCRATALRGPVGVVLLAFEDITADKRREEELRRAHESVREAGRRKNEFLAVLSHELRNPLAPIRNCLFLLARAEPGGELAKKAQAILERQVNHLTRLVDDLLDVTRITRGKIILQREPLELSDLVRKTIEDHRATFAAGGIALEGPCDAGPLPVHGDSARLVQALSNLLGNAQKFSSAGGTVTVSLHRVGCWAVLAVKDNGVGIAQEVLDRLFEPFVQGPQSIDRARGGLGLGLATVKGLVELHGGSVAIASAGQDAGTTVTLTLPLDPGASSAPAFVTPPSGGVYS